MRWKEGRMDDVRGLLSLLSIPGIGPYRIRNLIGHFGSPGAVLEAGTEDLRRVEGIDEKTARSIRAGADPGFPERQMMLTEKLGVRMVSYWDAEYPELLKSIYDPPVLLYVKGSLEDLPERRLAVVGMRSPSETGKTVAESFAADLARCGVAVVSGMARGIDTAAHRGCIRAGGKTVAVLGSGVDVVYPPENIRLYNRIAAAGAVISEFPMNAEPAASHFPRRNRIISGMSRGTVVVEAGERSGALITAYMALEQGREVFAVPGSVRSSKSRGAHRLIKEGAKLVEGVEDILAEIPQWADSAGDAGAAVSAEKILTEEEMVIWGALGDSPVHIDSIVKAADRSPSEALALLLSMELKDCVKQMPGMRFMRR